MRVTYDPETDKAYIEIAPRPRGTAGIILHEDDVHVGVQLVFDGLWRLVGIELRQVSRNVHPNLLDIAEPGYKPD